MFCVHTHNGLNQTKLLNNVFCLQKREKYHHLFLLSAKLLYNKFTYMRVRKRSLAAFFLS